MIEKIILNYLKSVLDCPVYMEEPKDKPDKFVLIQTTGASRVHYIYSATVTLQSYDKTLLKAAELNEAVKNAMFGIITCPEVASSRLNSDYNFTDVTTKRYRYQAVFELIHY